MTEIFSQDREILKRLASDIVKIGSLPIQKEKMELWRRLNDREPTRPLVYINEEPMTELIAFSTELQCQCSDPFLKSIEHGLRYTLYRWKHYPVDHIILPEVQFQKVFSSTGIGITQQGSTIDNNAVVSQHFDAQISEIEDIEKIQMPVVTYDAEETQRRYEMLSDILDGVAPVRLKGVRHIWFTPWDNLIRLVDIQSIMMDMIMRPDFVNALVSQYVDAKMHELDQIENLGLLDAGALNVRVGSGAYGYTRDLPAETSGRDGLPCRQLWGCGNAQIFSDVSPDMHWEFSLRHEMRWLERWGMTYYGCCEALHNKLDILRCIPNLRKISVSPWFDIPKGIDNGADEYVLSVKLNPAVFATDVFHEDQARREISDLLDQAEGCNVEVIMKDISTVRNDPMRIERWGRIAMEEVEKRTP
jgi:hypothetical protein